MQWQQVLSTVKDYMRQVAVCSTVTDTRQFRAPQYRHPQPHRKRCVHHKLKWPHNCLKIKLFQMGIREMNTKFYSESWKGTWSLAMPSRSLTNKTGICITNFALPSIAPNKMHFPPHTSPKITFPLNTGWWTVNTLAIKSTQIPCYKRASYRL